MTKIEDLLTNDVDHGSLGPRPEIDPLTEADALQEAQLIGARFDPLTRTAALLFDLRAALQLREGNTGVLVANSVTMFGWSAFDPPGMIAWMVGSSSVEHVGDRFGLRLTMWPAPGAQLRLLGRRAAFFAADVPGIGEAPPDYSDLDGPSVRGHVAGWSSQFHPVSAVRLG